MFSRIIAISVKELKLLLRDGAALGVLFLLPIVFVSIMTYAGVGRQGVQTVSILVVNEDQGPAAGWIIERLKKDRNVEIVSHVDGVAVDAAHAASTIKDPRQSHAMAMVFPKDFSERLLKGEGKGNEGVVRLVVDPAVGDESIVPYERLIRTRVMEVAAAIQMMRDSEHLLKQLAGRSAAEIPDAAIRESGRGLARRGEAECQDGAGTSGRRGAFKADDIGRAECAWLHHLRYLLHCSGDRQHDPAREGKWNHHQVTGGTRVEVRDTHREAHTVLSGQPDSGRRSLRLRGAGVRYGSQGFCTRTAGRYAGYGSGRERTWTVDRSIIPIHRADGPDVGPDPGGHGGTGWRIDTPVRDAKADAGNIAVHAACVGAQGISGCHGKGVRRCGTGSNGWRAVRVRGCVLSTRVVALQI